MLEPATVATRTQILAASTHGFAPSPDRITASSQGGFMSPAEANWNEHSRRFQWLMALRKSPGAPSQHGDIVLPAELFGGISTAAFP
jgi:hypothetical protein